MYDDGRGTLVLAFALCAFHVYSPVAHAEDCNTAVPENIGGSLSVAPPVAVGKMRDRMLTLDGTPVVRFGVESYFMDSDGDLLEYTVESSPSGVATAEMCGSILKIGAVSPGTTTVTVTASDGIEKPAVQSFDVTVGIEGGNRKPELKKEIPDITLTAGGSFAVFYLDDYFSDPEGLRLRYSVSSLDTNIVTTGIYQDQMLITPDSVGEASLKVTATDPGYLSVSQSFVVTVVEGENRAPIAVGTISDTTVTVQNFPDDFSFDVHWYFFEQDDDTLTYSASSSNTEVASTSVLDSTLTVTALSAGTATLTVTATDPGDLTAEQDFEVLFNRRPVLVGTISDTTLVVNASLVFDVSPYFTDTDGDTLTYSTLSIQLDVASASIAEGGSTLTVNALSVGTSHIVVSAADSLQASVSRFFQVAVTAGPLEVDITSGPTTTIDSGAENTWEAAASGGVPSYTYRWEYATRCIDASLIRTDDPPCVWQWTNAGTDSTFTQTITTPESSAGVRVTATDSATPTASSVMDSVIVSVNHAPDTVGTISARTIIRTHPDVSFSVALFFSDPDNNSLTYSASSSDTSLVTTSMSGSTLTLTAVAADTATVTVTATDPGGLSSAPQAFAVVVEDPPPDLIALITGPTSIVSGTENTWGSTVTGGTTPYTYSWRYATRCVNDNLLYSRDEPCTLQWTSAGSDSTFTQTITTTNNYAHIELTVTDSASPEVSVTRTRTVTVTQPPAEPTTVGTISDRTLTAGGSSSSFSVSSYFSSPNVDDILTYSASSSNTGIVSASIPQNSSTLTIAPVSAGTATVTVTATIVNGGSATQSFLVTVNSEPVVSNSIADRTLTAGGSSATFNLDNYFSDPDGDDLTYSASSSPSGILSASVSGSTLTIAPVSAGSATVTVTADDGEDDVSQSVAVTVNSEPVVSNSIADRTLTAGGSSATFDLDNYFSDPDGDDLTYSASSSPSGIVSASVSGSTLTIAPVSAGSATVTVTADDGEDDVSQSVAVTVNSEPVVSNSIPDRTLTAGGSSATFDLDNYFSDPDGDDLTYSASSSPSGIVSASVSGSTLTIAPVSAGSATVTVTADDGEDDVSQSVTVTVNAALTVSITGPTSIVSGTENTWGSTVTGGTTPYTYSWRYSVYCVDDNLLYSREEPCTLQWISAGSDSTFTQTITTTNNYAHIELTVTDSASPEVSVTRTRTVTVTQPPGELTTVGTISDRTLTIGYPSSSFSVSSYFSSSNADDILTYSASSSDTGILSASIPQNSSTLTIAPVSAGTATVTVTATIVNGGSATQSFDVTVNRKPVVSNSISDQTLTAGGSSATFDLDDYFSDPDGDNLTYAANTSSSVATASVSGSTLTITPVSAGTATVTVIAADPSQAVATQSVGVTVSTAAGA